MQIWREPFIAEKAREDDMQGKQTLKNHEAARVTELKITQERNVS